MDFYCGTHTVANHVVSCIDYNVAKEPVSIHQPLTRILAGLLAQASKYSQALQDIEASIRSSVSIQGPYLY